MKVRYTIELNLENGGYSVKCLNLSNRKKINYNRLKLVLYNSILDWDDKLKEKEEKAKKKRKI